MNGCFRNNLPLVSVVIPFYSNVDWLVEAVESVFNQTYQAIEVIVINDGSKESMTAFIERYSERIIYIEQENAGAAKARNAGIELAQGKYIAFLDSDDIWEKEKLELQINAMETVEAIWSATGYRTFGGSKSKEYYPPKIDRPAKDFFYNTMSIGTPTVVVMREALGTQDDFRFPNDMKVSQDVCLWMKLSNKYRLLTIDKILCNVRMHGNNASKRGHSHIMGRAMIWAKMKNHDANLSVPTRRLTRMGYQYCDFISTHIRISRAQALIWKILYAPAYVIFRCDTMLLRRGKI